MQMGLTINTRFPILTATINNTIQYQFHKSRKIIKASFCSAPAFCVCFETSIAV